MVATTNCYRSTWYPDSCVKHHVTSDSANLVAKSEYNGFQKKVMILDCLFNTLFQIHSFLRMMIGSVSKFARDNNVLFEFHPQ